MRQIENPVAQAPLLEDLYEQVTAMLACIVVVAVGTPATDADDERAVAASLEEEGGQEAMAVPSGVVSPSHIHSNSAAQSQQNT